MTSSSQPFPAEKVPLETLLLRSGMLTLRQIAEAQRIEEESGKSFTDVVVENGWVAADAIAALVAENEPVEPTGPPAVYVVLANLDDGARLEVSEHPDEAAARVSAAGAVELIESNSQALLELGDRRFPAYAVQSVEIVEFI